VALLHCKEGPKCSLCPLVDQGVIVHDDMPEMEWSGLAIVGETPTYYETKQRSVFINKAGKFVKALLENQECAPNNVYFTNMIRCGLPNKVDNDVMHMAAECCKPLLLHNLQELDASTVLCLGSAPAHWLMGIGRWSLKSGYTGVAASRGVCLGADDEFNYHITCANHPATFLNTAARYPLVEVFRDDLKKALDLAHGELGIWEPEVRDAADVDELVEWLDDVIVKAREAKEKPVAIDVETNGKDALTCLLRTIGLSFDEVGYSIPYAEWYQDFYTKDEWDRIKSRFITILTDPKIDTVYQNKMFDITVLEFTLDLKITGVRWDTLLLHHALYPKTKHDLQSITSQYLTTEPWKQLFNEIGFDWADEETEEEFGNLLWYNAQDTVATETICHIMRREAISMGVSRVQEHDNFNSDFGIDMYHNGIRLDMVMVDKLEKQYRHELKAMLLELQRMVGESVEDPARLGLKTFSGTRPKQMKKGYGFNPRSPNQLRAFLYNHLGLTPQKLTEKKMEPSTSKDALWELRDETDYIGKHFKYKDKATVYSSYLKDVRTKKATDDKIPYLYENGRIHPQWKIQSTPAGRYGTTPIVQNFTSEMLKMFITEDGFLMIGADYATLEVRIVAALAGQMDLVDLFNNGADIHAIHASTIFYKKAWEIAKAAGDIKTMKRLRNNGKPVTFGKNYRAGDEVLYEQIREDRPDEKADDLRREVSIMSRELDKKYPDIVRAAEFYHTYANDHYYLKSAIIGRIRKWPLGNAKPTDCANHPIQSTAADVVNLGTERWVNSMKKDEVYNIEVFPILQIHDSLFAEVEIAKVEQERKRLEECLYWEGEIVSPVTGKGVFVKLPAEANIGESVFDCKVEKYDKPYKLFCEAREGKSSVKHKEAIKTMEGLGLEL